MRAELLALQALSVLVIDLGYDEAPVYGNNPIRHLLLWNYIEKIIGKEGIAREMEMNIAIRVMEKMDTKIVIRVTEKGE